MFSLEHVWPRRGDPPRLRQADERVTDSDAFFRDRHPVLRPQPLVPEAERTAARRRRVDAPDDEILEQHPVNATGERAPKLNVITLKWWGRLHAVPSFRGAARPARHVHRRVGVPPRPRHRRRPRHDRGARDARPGGRPARPAHARERAARRRRHLRLRPPEGDRRGGPHQGPARQAADDRGARRGAAPTSPTDRAIVCVTGDHCTPASPEVIHSGDPVPFVLAGPGVRADAVRAFGELDCAAGILGHLRGPDMMPVLLNAADRPLFLGSRPTPFDGADGYPDVPRAAVDGHERRRRACRSFEISPLGSSARSAITVRDRALADRRHRRDRPADRRPASAASPGRAARPGQPFPEKGIPLLHRVREPVGRRARDRRDARHRARGVSRARAPALVALDGASACSPGRLRRLRSGYLTVRFELNPYLVMTHFLLSAVVLGAAGGARRWGRWDSSEEPCRRPCRASCALAAIVAAAGCLHPARHRHRRDRRRPAPRRLAKVPPALAPSGRRVRARCRHGDLRDLLRASCSATWFRAARQAPRLLWLRARRARARSASRS